MRLALLALAFAVATPVLAATPAPRTPEQRQTLIDLAFVLGQAHALHRVCAGKDDDTWRGRMQRVIEMDGADPAFRSRLSSSFNAGFVSPDAQAKDCAKATAAERRLAARGSALAGRLAAPNP